MKYKLPLFLLIFFLKLSPVMAFQDNSEEDNSYFQASVYSGVSLGKNKDTYKYGGRLAVGVGLHYYKNKTFGGLDLYKTSFKDADNPDFKVGNWVKTKAVQKVYVFSANIGKQLGSRQNISISGGLGYLRYQYPILKYHGSFFGDFYTVDSYNSKETICLTSSMKFYLNNRKSRLFALINAYASKQISFLSLTAGFEFKLKPGEKTLFAPY